MRIEKGEWGGFSSPLVWSIPPVVCSKTSLGWDDFIPLPLVVSDQCIPPHGDVPNCDSDSNQLCLVIQFLTSSNHTFFPSLSNSSLEKVTKHAVSPHG